MQSINIVNYEKDKPALNSWIRNVVKELSNLQSTKLSTYDVEYAVHTDSSSGADRRLFLPDSVATLRNLPTQGLGVPGIRIASNIQGKVAAIASTKLYCPSRQGLYRLSYYTVIDVTGVAGTHTLTFTWKDSSATTQTVSSAAVAVTGVGNYAQGSLILLAGANTNITYATAFSVNTATYDLYLTLEELC